MKTQLFRTTPIVASQSAPVEAAPAPVETSNSRLVALNAALDATPFALETLTAARDAAKTFLDGQAVPTAGADENADLRLKLQEANTKITEALKAQRDQLKKDMEARLNDPSTLPSQKKAIEVMLKSLGEATDSADATNEAHIREQIASSKKALDAHRVATQADLMARRGYSERAIEGVEKKVDVEEVKAVAQLLGLEVSQINGLNIRSFLEVYPQVNGKDYDDWKKAGYIPDGTFWAWELSEVNDAKTALQASTDTQLASKIETLLAAYKAGRTGADVIRDASVLEKAKEGVGGLTRDEALIYLFDFDRSGALDAATSGAMSEVLLGGLFSEKNGEFTDAQRAATLNTLLKLGGSNAAIANMDALSELTQKPEAKLALERGLSALGRQTNGGVDLYKLLQANGDLPKALEATQKPLKEFLKTIDAQISDVVTKGLADAENKLETSDLSAEEKATAQAYLDALKNNPQQLIARIRMESMNGFLSAIQGREGLGASVGFGIESSSAILRAIKFDVGMFAQKGGSVLPGLAIHVDGSTKVSDTVRLSGTAGLLNFVIPFAGGEAGYTVNRDALTSAGFSSDIAERSVVVDAGISTIGGTALIGMREDMRSSIEERKQLLSQGLDKLFSTAGFDAQVTKDEIKAVELFAKIPDREAQKIAEELSARLEAFGLAADMQEPLKSTLLEAVKRPYIDGAELAMASDAATKGYELSGLRGGVLLAPGFVFPLLGVSWQKVTVDRGADASYDGYAAIDRQYGSEIGVTGNATEVDVFLEKEFSSAFDLNVALNDSGFLEIKGLPQEFVDISRAESQATYVEGVLTVGSGAQLKAYTQNGETRLYITAKADATTEMTAFAKTVTIADGRQEVTRWAAEAFTGNDLTPEQVKATKDAMLALSRTQLDQLGRAPIALQRAVYCLDKAQSISQNDRQVLGPAGEKLVQAMTQGTKPDAARAILAFIEMFGRTQMPALADAAKTINSTSDRAVMQFVSLIGEYAMGEAAVRKRFQSGITAGDKTAEMALVNKYLESLTRENGKLKNQAEVLGIQPLIAESANAIRASNEVYAATFDSLGNGKVATHNETNGMYAVVNNRMAVRGVESRTGHLEVISGVEQTLTGLSVAAKKDILKQFPVDVYTSLAKAVNKSLVDSGIQDTVTAVDMFKLLSGEKTDGPIAIDAAYVFTRAAVCRNEAFGVKDIKISYRGQEVADISVWDGGSAQTNTANIATRNINIGAGFGDAEKQTVSGGGSVGSTPGGGEGWNQNIGEGTSGPGGSGQDAGGGFGNGGGGLGLGGGTPTVDIPPTVTSGPIVTVETASASRVATTANVAAGTVNASK